MSKLGGSDVGWYNLAGIKWKDLGRKYIIKRGKKSLIADHDFGTNSSQKHYRTMNDLYDGNADQPIRISLNQLHTD